MKLCEFSIGYILNVYKYKRIKLFWPNVSFHTFNIISIIVFEFHIEGFTILDKNNSSTWRICRFYDVIVLHQNIHLGYRKFPLIGRLFSILAIFVMLNLNLPLCSIIINTKKVFEFFFFRKPLYMKEKIKNYWTI